MYASFIHKNVFLTALNNRSNNSGHYLQCLCYNREFSQVALLYFYCNTLLKSDVFPQFELKKKKTKNTCSFHTLAVTNCNQTCTVYENAK